MPLMAAPILHFNRITTLACQTHGLHTWPWRMVVHQQSLPWSQLQNDPSAAAKRNTKLEHLGELSQINHQFVIKQPPAPGMVGHKFSAQGAARSCSRTWARCPQWPRTWRCPRWESRAPRSPRWVDELQLGEGQPAGHRWSKGCLERLV